LDDSYDLCVEGVERVAMLLALQNVRRAAVATCTVLAGAIISVLITQGQTLSGSTRPILAVFLVLSATVFMASLGAQWMLRRVWRNWQVRRGWHDLENLKIWTRRDARLGMVVTDDTPEVPPVDGRPIDFSLVTEGRLPNLQRDFDRLGEAFDTWLVAGHRKRDGGLQVFWLVDEATESRQRGLMACMARAASGGRAVAGDAGQDLESAIEALSIAVRSRPASVLPVVFVDLRRRQDERAWERLSNVLTKANKDADIDRNGREPVFVVSGAPAQGQALREEVGDLVELTSVAANGLPQSRAYSFDGMSHPSDRVYNRGLPITSKTLFGRGEELDLLRSSWESDDVRVLSIVAQGGAGKSALINEWLRELKNDGYPGAEKVLIWSFYSQGTREELVSADIFVNAALSWFGAEDARTLNPAARGEQLALHIKQHKALLVLDGLEPLQNPPDAPDVGGRLTDNSIRVLLEKLAEPDWDGLCVITTRVGLRDLESFEDGQRGQGHVHRKNLGPLDEADGAKLLAHLIEGHPAAGELREAVREVGGHALAITLLGNYIREVHRGDLRRRVYLERLTLDTRAGGHARRIMAAYANWLEANDRLGELAILRLMGLFDRPAEPAALTALLAGVEAVSGLGELGAEAWLRCVATLMAMGLLNTEAAGPSGSLDAHPLVREHFREELKTKRADIWLAGHRVLYDHYRGRAPYRPVSTEGMQPLYAAVTHGCAAGLHQQVFDEVLLNRIWRDRRTNYSTRHLGMTGADLVALSNYFQAGSWRHMREVGLSTPARVLALTNAGVRLRQLGELADARDSFSAVALEIDTETAEPEELADASYAAAQYSELLVIAGKLIGASGGSDNALQSASSAIKYADGGNDPYFRMHARSSLGEVHFMLGDMDSAGDCFAAATAIDHDFHPRPPFLYSQGLYRYGYYLIEQGRAQELLSASSSEGWGENGDDSSLLSKAILLLVLGAARRSLIEHDGRSPALLQEAEEFLDSSYNRFRNAGYADYTVRALIERAHFRCIRGELSDYGHARRDLDEATFEVQRGEMDLLYVDVLLQRAACYLGFLPRLNLTERSHAGEMSMGALTEAEKLVAETGYKRREPMIANLRKVAADAGLA
jgi:tetratricopeptide (TPR) repeat protein